MSTRVDSASRLIRASAPTIYQAFATADAMTTWMPPRGMSGSMLAFDFREGGSYRLRLRHNQPTHAQGKTSKDSDEVEVRFVVLVPNERIEQAVTFASDDPSFSGEMRITWTFEPARNGTLVGVRCEDVPAGIRPEDHQAGLTSTLDNLAVFAERGSE